MTSTKPRRLLAVMFTDVVGYTALMQRDEDAARTVRRRHRDAVDAAVSAHRGDLLQYLGDGSLTMFPSVADAVRAAIDVQRGLRQDPIVPLRVGIHQGDISYDTQGAYGDSVNVASRIQSLAIAGSVLISAKAQDEIKNRPDIDTTPLGDFELKNVTNALAVRAVVSEGLVVPTRGDILEGIRSAPVTVSDVIERLNSALEGRYRIERGLGEGGMATVYLAEDLRHGRKVAVKVLKPELAAVVGGERFLAEIKTTASLQHPHILGLHDSGEAEGFLFFVMPLVDGASLRKRLDTERQLSVDEAVRIATQVGEALDYAHRQGVLHRDIKPENILLQDGQAVVADFGIALAVSAAGGARLTETGMSMGTPHYMSPEQATGDRQLSPESDIYSLGCVLYEMLAGDPPHLGSTAQSILAKIFNEDPTPLSVFRNTVPTSVEAATHRALEKTPADRFRSAAEFTEALIADRDPVTWSGPNALPTPPNEAARGGVRVRRIRYIGVALGSLAAAAAVAFGVAEFAGPNEAGPESAPSHRQLTFEGDATDAALSPDGTSVVYVTGRSGEHQRLMLADLSGGQAIEIFNGSVVVFPAWSPDGSAVVVSAIRDQPPPLQAYRVPRLGGEPRHLGNGGFTTWSADGSRIAFALSDQRGFRVFSESTGDSESITLEGYDFTGGLSWSPTADQLAVLTSSATSGLREIFTVTSNGTDRRSVVALPDPLSSPRWAPSGRAMYFLRHRNNLADLLRVDLTRDGQAWSDPRVVLSGLQAAEAFNTAFNLTADGRTLAYGTRQVFTHLWLGELAGDASDRVPETRQLTGGTSWIERPSISPDGRWIAYSAQTSAGANIFKMPITGGDPTQLTFSDAYQTSPAWAPDGSSIAFTARDEGGAHVWVMGSDGTEPREFPLTEVSAGGMRVVWSPGDRPLYQRPGNQNFHYLNLVTGEEEPLIHDAAFGRRPDERGYTFYPEYSPAGERVALAWNRAPALSLWSITREPYSERMLAQEGLTPIGWSSDGRWVYVIAGFPYGNFVGRVPAAGGENEILFTLAGDVKLGTVDPSGTKIVANVATVRSDVFVVEDFDPRRR